MSHHLKVIATQWTEDHVTKEGEECGALLITAVEYMGEPVEFNRVIRHNVPGGMSGSFETHDPIVEIHADGFLSATFIDPVPGFFEGLADSDYLLGSTSRRVSVPVSSIELQLCEHMAAVGN